MISLIIQDGYEAIVVEERMIFLFKGSTFPIFLGDNIIGRSSNAFPFFHDSCTSLIPKSQTITLFDKMKMRIMLWDLSSLTH